VATTPAKRACPVCGTLLPEEGEFCLVCALRQAIETQSDSGTDTSCELRFEHYTVLQNPEGKPFELGRGAMGVTYKAFDVHLQRPAALKIINSKLFGNESARHRFIREARSAASVRHQNVASVFHIGQSGGNYYYAMEFVEGESLEKLIQRSGCLETDLALDIVEQVAFGLAAIQEQHLVHRDIKPSNIMVSFQDGKLRSAKIIDLGLAKGVAEENTLSTVGAFVGTPAYASPEQFAGVATDIRSDLYSLGVTLWEMLSGKVPFSGSAAELMYQHQRAEPPIEKLRNVPVPVIALLQVLLAKDPNQRFQTPAQSQQALTRAREAIASGSKLTVDELRSAGELVAPRSPKAKPRKRTIRWVVGSGLCVAAVAIAWFFLSGHLGLFNQRSTGAAPTEKSIAVLPFDNISPNKDDTFFADGVQDEILNNLAKIAQLKVICRTSVMQYRADAKRDLRQIAIALGVANVLEGTVRRDGNHVRVSTELVDARDGTAIWADSYDRDLTDIFAIQSEIAQAVASRLSTQLSPEERKDIEQKPTDNLEAYDLYLQAKQLLEANYWAWTQRRGKEIYLKALSLLREATQKDQKFALAYCLVAKAHGVLYADGTDHTPERRALGDAAVNEALRLRPDLPEAHLAMAFHLYICYRDFERARVQIAIAAKNIPNNPDLLHLSALTDQVQGHWEKAIADLERAATLDPRNPDLLDTLARSYFSLRRYRDMERILDRLIELDPDQPSHGLSKTDLAFAEKADVKAARADCEAVPPSVKDDPAVESYRVYYAICARDFAAAEEILTESPNEEINFYGALVPRQIWSLWLEFILGNHPTIEQFGAVRERLYQKVEADPTDPYLLAALAKADVALGHSKEAIQEGRRAMEMLPISEDAVKGPDIATNFAFVCAWANQLDLAFEQLNILVKIPAGRLNYGDLKTYPGWDPLRNDPRFEKLLAELAPQEPADKSIAVLPFESLSDNKSDAYFADGVQDEILNNLAKIAQLKVISRTSVMQYRADAKRDLREIAAALGVANVLEGTVRRDGNHVRVSTELVDARNDNTIWADSYDRDLTDIFAIQSEVAQTIATKLAATLSPEEKRYIEKKPTENLEAYDLYLRAKELFVSVRVSMSFGNVEKPLVDAIGFLEQAVRLDPKFTLAYCASAQAHDNLYFLYGPTPEQRALGDAAVNSALGLQPDLPEVHLAYAHHLYIVYGDYERARVQLAIARRGLPNDAEAIVLGGRIDRRQGQFEKAIQEFNQAITRDPRNTLSIQELAETLFNTRQFRAAEQAFDRLIDLRPDQPILKVQKPLFITFYETGDDTAVRAAIAGLPASMADDREVLSLRLMFALVDRDWPEAREFIGKMGGGEDEGNFAYAPAAVPVGCYFILLARLQGEQPGANVSFSETREQLNQKVQKLPGYARLLSQLAVIDALLNNKDAALSEAKRAVEILPISKDAVFGPDMVMNLAVVYAWTDEFDLAFETLSPLTKMPCGIFYGLLKRDPYWEPLRKDPRFEKLLAELAPRD